MSRNLLGTTFAIPHHPEDDIALERFFSLRFSPLPSHLRFASPSHLRNIIACALADASIAPGAVATALDDYFSSLRLRINLPPLSSQQMQQLDETGAFEDYCCQYPLSTKDSLASVHPMDLAGALQQLLAHNIISSSWLCTTFTSCTDKTEIVAPLDPEAPSTLMEPKHLFPRRISILPQHRQHLPLSLLLQIVKEAASSSEHASSSISTFLLSLHAKRILPSHLSTHYCPTSHTDDLSVLHPLDCALLLAHLIKEGVIEEFWVQKRISAILTKQSHARNAARRDYSHANATTTKKARRE